ncbi:putative proton-dependent oligopeptide transporter family, PTR2 family proton/oligopeptide symporter [Dioscorea sansibarensis]
MESGEPLLAGEAAIALIGMVDHRGRPIISRSRTGGWTSALFIIGVEVAERFAFYGVSSNLITYLTGPLQESTAAAAAAVNTWSGAASMLPLLGAFVADSYLGRYRTIVISSLLYVLGLGLLTLSSMLPSLSRHKCSTSIGPTTCPPTQFQVIAFYVSLYLVAFAQGGHKPCTQAFGGDQFDPNDPEESKSKSSFFNWWYFGLCLGTVVTLWILNFVQDNIGWGLGFGIPCIAMMLALSVFLLGTTTYRYYVLQDTSPFVQVYKAFVTMIKSHRTPLPYSSADAPKVDNRIEEAKGVIRLFPIWATCLIYAVVFSQSSTFFTKQGSTMERHIGPNFQLPPATLQSFISISVVMFIPIYDRILVPITRKFSGVPSGISMLQRIGTGMVLSILSMVIAALVEMKRLQTANDYGLVDKPQATIPMSLWWLVPQYVLYGIADVFTMVGLQEFFYDQVPDSLRSLGLALYLSIFGIGSLISGFLVSVINEVTGKDGHSWFSNNLNRAHLDYFYWLLAGLSALQFAIYLCCAQCYVYKKQK